ncbi:VTT domain-containing protein [Myroides marinus]|jgi:membrane-associated protein|uniref:Alkaline phosphatase n=1 Tax=Myroides marinus TaxID=703342 RepID=A0A164A6C5_9FLAO|nr:VTT domain-containing protein [Myroides marinus]MDR0193678.1 VTT domain-containing protein [Myroides sp.]KUF45392.1 alkaline phosphatase [Myroides marinus]KZE83037.1 alkaline phosphatase [Myroides marinus]MDM1345548.1 VTT domain-containing protein [Myroides marinus]MDM1349137.1 VTT domain-containing protein [Myroides marinus]
MDEFTISQLINPEFYINLQIAGHSIGIYVVLFIVFAETGLFAGFFLPGDSLLFLSGIYSTALMEEVLPIESDFLNVALLATLVALSGILGNSFGYWFGKKSGNYLYNVKDNFIYKKKYLYESKVFFERHGGRAIIFARFLPVVRTFAPIIAGIVHMDIKKFMLYNVISSFLWATTLIFAGHYLQVWLLNDYGIDLKHYIEYIILFLVLVTTLPVILKLVKSKGGKKEVDNVDQA